MYTGYSSLPDIKNGVNDIKGQFYGKYQENHPVTVFHIENFYAYAWKLTCGLIQSGGKYLVKMTPNTKDGSTATVYNTDGTGYINTNISAPDGYGTYIKGMTLHSKHGMFPSDVSDGSATTYFCDGYWTSNTGVRAARVGGHAHNDMICGAFTLAVHLPSAADAWYFGVALSYK